MILKGHCENFIRIPLVVSQKWNLKSDRLEHSISVYLIMCLYLQWSTFRIYAIGTIPHVILIVFILGFQKGV